MNKEKATIYDYARLCDYYKSKSLCDKCPMLTLCSNKAPSYMFAEKSNEIILNWCKEHPVKTRQDKFLEMFPNAYIYTDGVLKVRPCSIFENFVCIDNCEECRSKYWLVEVKEQ